MITIRWKILAPNEGASLCATCSWGVVRRGFCAGEAQAFCRILVPNERVPFPVSECTAYVDGRAPDPWSKTAGRGIGFVPLTAIAEQPEEEPALAAAAGSPDAEE